MNHTPGPWKAKAIMPQVWLINAGADPDLRYKEWDSLARVYGSDDGPVIGREKVEANARLIAAAPELLEACEIAYQSDDLSVKDILRAAIAKAKGEA